MNLTEKYWGKIYRQNISKLIGTCYRYVPNKQIAEDLTHDAFINAINKSDTFKGDGCIEAWLRRIVINTALQHLRKQNANKIFVDLELHENKIMEIVDDENDIGIIEKADFTKDELLNAIANLPEHHKLVFNMYVIDGYTHFQIGEELGISEGTSKSHLARARKKLQQLLNEKALEKQRKKDWKRAFIILIFPAKAKGVDQVFLETFNSFRITPNIPLLLNNLNISTTAGSITNTVIISAKSVIVTTISAAVIIGAIYIAANQKIEKQKNNGVIVTDSSIQNIEIQDTIVPSIKPDTTMKSTFKDTLLKKNTPVIIKKTIIKRNAVVVQKPLILKDSTNAE